MKLTYIGRHDAVEVDLPNGGGFEVERGQDTPELDADVAASLLEQTANWEAADEDAEIVAEHLVDSGTVEPRAGDDNEEDAE